MSQEQKKLEDKAKRLAKEREKLIAKAAKVETELLANQLKLQAERQVPENDSTKKA